MAGEEACSSQTGSWPTIMLRYDDGFELKVRLDRNTVRRLENGDEELMYNIRRNVEAAQSSSLTDSSSTDSQKTENEVFKDNHDATVSERSDVEEPLTSSEDKSYNFWSREATLYLISLYKDFEKDMEDPRKTKKDVWAEITESMNKKNYNFTQNKIECKWRSLIQSHKNIRDSKNQTGQKRKTFQYFEEMSEILTKRHDINPPCTGGSGLKTPEGSKRTKYSTKSSPSESPSCSSDSSIEDDTEKKKGKHLVKGLHKQDSNNNEVLAYLQAVEKRQTEAWQEREKKKNERAQERNAILKEFLNIFKEK